MNVPETSLPHVLSSRRMEGPGRGEYGPPTQALRQAQGDKAGGLVAARALALALLVVAGGFVSACGDGSPADTEATPAAEAAAPPAAEAGHLRALPAQDYGPAVEESLATALAAYDEVRVLLAADRTDGLAARASRLAQALALAA
ncbi:MAG TPA: hypothetical protein VLF66_00495, partial [Thermoanaerobaculia bacterium]|nr:hypothetical protein [Thermoanaerobaculia bacterium]